MSSIWLVENYGDEIENMKLLALGPQNVYPPVDGGKESIFGALGALVMHAEIAYVYPGADDKGTIAGYENIGVRASRLITNQKRHLFS